MISSTVNRIRYKRFFQDMVNKKNQYLPFAFLGKNPLLIKYYVFKNSINQSSLNIAFRSIEEHCSTVIYSFMNRDNYLALLKLELASSIAEIIECFKKKNIEYKSEDKKGFKQIGHLWTSRIYSLNKFCNYNKSTFLISEEYNKGIIACRIDEV